MFSAIRGSLAFILFFLNILIMPTLVIFFGFLKWLTPFAAGKKLFWHLQNNTIPSLWIDINSFILLMTSPTKLHVKGEGNLREDHWYILASNHRSWADIIIIQKIFNRKIPTLKFFMKQELLWTLPLGGVACWMLGFPFMKRHSKAYLKKHPEMKGKDIETARQACNNFKLHPTTVVNFLEGTRFTERKRADRSSPYRNLLRPKVGGVAFVTSTLKDYMHELIDVTIVYSPFISPTFWQFLSGKIKEIHVIYRVLPIPEDFSQDYHNNPETKRAYQNWINQIWQEKDQIITELEVTHYGYKEA